MKNSVKLVVMPSQGHDYGKFFEESFNRLGLDYEIAEIPLTFLKDTNPVFVKRVREMLSTAQDDQQVIFCPGVMELYLQGSHHSVHFSAYRDWHDAARQTVIPHPWTIHDVADRARFAWQEKPALSAGFMGSAYRDATLVKIGQRLPKSWRRNLLKGRYLRHPLPLAKAFQLGLPARFTLAFPRAESLEALESQAASQPDLTADIVDTGGFTGSDSAKDRYVSSMLGSTYAICPRGSENFSFRAYEALHFGRIPVIIDTDMVHPDNVPWEEVAIILPYEKLDQLADILRADHAAHDGDAFARRQQKAFAAMDALADGHWLDTEITRILALGN